MLLSRQLTNSAPACIGPHTVQVRSLFCLNRLNSYAYTIALRRHGEWRRDLNEDLTLPFTRNIASSWAKVFETDLMGPFGIAVVSTVNKLLIDIENTAAPGLKDRIKIQAEMSLAQASETLRTIIDVVQKILTAQQKEVSRCMSPHVRSQLISGYDQAMEERGIGSVARQKVQKFTAMAKNLILNRLLGRLSILHC